MWYEIAARIPCYDTDAVGCFDPTKVVVRIRDTIPGVIVCVHNYAWDRYEAFKMHGLSDPATEITANDAVRRGPIYQFRIYVPGSDQIIKGTVERYSIRVTSDDPILEPLKTKLVALFEAFTLDSICVTCLRREGNETEEV